MCIATLTRPPALLGLWDRFRTHRLYRSLHRRESRQGVDAVLVSHAHLGHNGDISYLKPIIPVYASYITAFIARAMQTCVQMEGIEWLW